MKNQKNKHDWRNRTIAFVENRDYGDPGTAPTDMVRRCIQLTRIPLKDFTPANLRLMINQKIALAQLVVLAMEHLRENILLNASLYEGDLLESVLKVSVDFWKENREIWVELKTLLESRCDELQAHGINTTFFDAVFE